MPNGFAGGEEEDEKLDAYMNAWEAPLENGANILRPQNEDYDGVTHLGGEMRGRRKGTSGDRFMEGFEDKFSHTSSRPVKNTVKEGRVNVL